MSYLSERIAMTIASVLPRRRKVRDVRTRASDDVEAVVPGPGPGVDPMVAVLARDLRTCSPRCQTDFDDMRAEHVQVDAECEFSVNTHAGRCSSSNATARPESSHHHQRHHRTSQSSNRNTSRKPLLAGRQLHRLGDLVVIGVCLLTFLSPTMAAPASPSHQRPKWINPCGLGSSDDIDSELVDLGLRLNDQELLSQIVVQAKNALMHADLFKDEYVKNTFNLDFQQHHDSWKKNHYEWLPSEADIPKKLGEPIPEQHLESLELDQALKDSYTYMQKMAVGLEQVAWDQNREHGDYHKEFMDTEYKLRATLCEIQVAILERNVMQHEDVTRDLMESKYRHMDNASYRNLRDWLIFRDYMNGLEYIIEVFEYFKHKLTS